MRLRHSEASVVRLSHRNSQESILLPEYWSDFNETQWSPDVSSPTLCSRSRLYKSFLQESLLLLEYWSVFSEARLDNPGYDCLWAFLTSPSTLIIIHLCKRATQLSFCTSHITTTFELWWIMKQMSCNVTDALVSECLVFLHFIVDFN